MLWSGSTKGVGKKLNLEEKFLLVIQHPVTTEYNASRRNIDNTIRAVSELNIPSIWIWPNVDAGSDLVSKSLRVFREKQNSDFLHLFRYLDSDIFPKVLNSCSCIVGNSSAGIKESSYLGVPSVNIGTRQKGRLKAENVIDVDYDYNEIRSAIVKQIKHGKYKPSNLYYKSNTSKNIASAIANINVSSQKLLHYDL